LTFSEDVNLLARRPIREYSNIHSLLLQLALPYHTILKDIQSSRHGNLAARQTSCPGPELLSNNGPRNPEPKHRTLEGFQGLLQKVDVRFVIMLFGHGPENFDKTTVLEVRLNEPDCAWVRSWEIIQRLKSLLGIHRHSCICPFKRRDKEVTFQ
jgi:hypothetical protein